MPCQPGPTRRRARRNTSASASRAPARATTSHSSGGMASSTAPAAENTVVNSTGNGFHDGPPVVSRSRCATSRPHTIQDQGSYVGAEGSRRESAASARHAGISLRIPARSPARGETV